MGGGWTSYGLVLAKKTAYGLWWAIDRATKKVCGWTLGDRGTQTARRLDAQLPHSSHITFCTDFWHPYGIIFDGEHHLQGTSSHLHHRKPQ